MGDLTIRSYWHCSSADEWSTMIKGSKGENYIVSFGRDGHKDRSVQRGWSCTCSAFKFQSGDCKHIKATKNSKLRCGWMQSIHGGAPVNDKCPKCKGSVAVVNHAE